MEQSNISAQVTQIQHGISITVISVGSSIYRNYTRKLTVPPYPAGAGAGWCVLSRVDSRVGCWLLVLVLVLVHVHAAVCIVTETTRGEFAGVSNIQTQIDHAKKSSL